MKAVTLKELKLELDNLSPNELRELCLRLSKFKKENKELLTYLLFESSDESSYINGIKEDMDFQFAQINRKSYYYIKKSVRKILSTTRKYIRYSKKKETEIELLIYFCIKLKKFSPSIYKSKALHNIYLRIIDSVVIKLASVHEDLQYDYGLEINALNSK
jgi:hypothetical protein